MSRTTSPPRPRLLIADRRDQIAATATRAARKAVAEARTPIPPEIRAQLVEALQNIANDDCSCPNCSDEGTS